MTQKKLSITCLAFLLSATAVLPLASAAKDEIPPSQSLTVKTIGKVSCVASTIEKNADGTLKKCVLAENKTVPGADITCAAKGPMTLNADGSLQQCILAFDRSYPEPVGVVCDDGKTIGLYPNGTLAKCTIAADGFARVLGGTCAAHQQVEVYPDGQLKSCVPNVEKNVAAAPTKEVYVTEFTCSAKKEISFYANGKVQQCTPTETVYMRGKGTCMGGESVRLQEDGKVADCTYTYPLYQNKSCSVEKKVSFHANGFFKDCTLPEDKTVGKAVCKADAPISYRANGTVAACTLAAPAEQAPGKILPAGTIVNIDEKHVITVKEAAPAAPAKPAAPAQPATPAQPAPAKK